MRSRRIYLKVALGGRCEDCDLRDALSPEGIPRWHPQLGYLLSAGCEGCMGSGVNSKTVVMDPSVLSRLTSKQRFVIERRLGLHDGKRYKQREIAKAMGISQPAVAQLERAAARRLLRKREEW